MYLSFELNKIGGILVSLWSYFTTKC